MSACLSGKDVAAPKMTQQEKMKSCNTKAAEMKGDETAARMLGGKRLQARDGSARPGGEGRADLRLEGVVAREDLCGSLLLTVAVVERLRLRERAGLRVGAQSEVERERRCPLSWLHGRDVAAGGEHADHDYARGDDGRERD